MCKQITLHHNLLKDSYHLPIQDLNTIKGSNTKITEDKIFLIQVTLILFHNLITTTLER